MADTGCTQSMHIAGLGNLADGYHLDCLRQHHGHFDAGGLSRMVSVARCLLVLPCKSLPESGALEHQDLGSNHDGLVLIVKVEPVRLEQHLQYC